MPKVTLDAEEKADVAYAFAEVTKLSRFSPGQRQDALEEFEAAVCRLIGKHTQRLEEINHANGLMVDDFRDMMLALLTYNRRPKP